MKVKIDFTKTNGTYEFSDSLNLTSEEFYTLGEEGIESLKQQRFDNWLAVITRPPNTITKEPDIIPTDSVIVDEVPTMTDQSVTNEIIIDELVTDDSITPDTPVDEVSTVTDQSITNDTVVQDPIITDSNSTDGI